MSLTLVEDGSELSTEVSAHLLGGKAINLLRLQETGLRVPRFYVISADALRGFLDGECCPSTADAPAKIAADVRQYISSTAIPPALDQAVRTAHARCFSDDSVVAVRSSTVGEDGEKHSFAGIHDSVLGVSDTEALFAAIKQVWASAFSPRAIAYRQQRNLPCIDSSMAVIVQQMIDAEQSGVCFTRHPATNSPHEMVIDSVYGLGEGLVSRGFAADSFSVAKQTLMITPQLADKTEQMILNKEQGALQSVEVAENLRHRSSLSDSQIDQVARAALAIESHFGRPQDIEFCFDSGGHLFILQTRPITSMTADLDANSERRVAGNHIVWNNSNIVESYSGVTTPMTFSFIRRAYSIVYHCFAEVMGISPRVVHRHRDAFNNMLGLFQGRVYYNLKNWYRLLRLFPGYNYNSRFMESMMGLKESLVLEDEPDRPGRLRRWFVELPALLGLLLRFGWNFLFIRHKVDRFQHHFQQHYDQWSKIDFDSLQPHEIMKLHGEMEDKLLWNWKAPIINDFYVMVFYGVLKKLCTTWCGDESGSLQNGLICGKGSLHSDEPAKLLIRMTHIARGDESLRGLILKEPVERLPALIAANPQFEPFNVLMRRYLDDYGLRCVHELKLEAFSYEDQPHRLYQIIRNFVQRDAAETCDLAAIEARERNVREDAEQKCEEAMSQSRSWFPRRLLFRWVLRNARFGVRNRESMRFARTRIYGILRKMLRSIGQHFTNEGILDDREDIFYLTIEEVWDYVRGTAVTTDLRKLASLRRAEYNDYRDESVPPPDNQFETFGMAYHRNQFCNGQPMSEADTNGALRGTGCCPGVVTGSVQILRDPTNATGFHGDILVAERTDPGWVPLFPAFSGILIERGSALSHSAVVARELGIPTIVGVTGLTQKLRCGQCVKMDGRTGAIEIVLDNAESAYLPTTSST